MDDIRYSFEYAFKASKVGYNDKQISSMLVWNEDHEMYENTQVDTAFYWYSKGFTTGERG